MKKHQDELTWEVIDTDVIQRPENIKRESVEESSSFAQMDALSAQSENGSDTIEQELLNSSAKMAYYCEDCGTKFTKPTARFCKKCGAPRELL